MKTLSFSIALLLCAANAPALIAPPPPTNTYTPPANIITLKADAEPDAVARDFGLTPVNVYRHAIKGFAVTVPTNQLPALKADPRVQAVEGNGRVYLCAQTNSTGFSRMGCKTYPMVHFNGVDDTRIDVDIAIMDSGVQTNHPDLNVYRAVTYSDLDPSQVGDWSGHGTHVAGIAAALDNGIGVVGVAPGARIWSIQIFSESQGGEWSMIFAGCDYVAQHADEIEIVNMSISNNGDPGAPFLAIQQTFSNLVSKGVVLIASAGNSSSDILGEDGIYGVNPTNNLQDDYLPAAIPWVSCVSGMMDLDGLPGQDYFTSFSNYSGKTNTQGYFVHSPGLGIDVCAPSYEIVSTWIGSSTNSSSGTSMAAPHVAGLAALYIAANGRATNAAGVFKIRQAIIDAAEPQSLWNGGAVVFDEDGMNHNAYVNNNWGAFLAGQAPPYLPTFFPEGLARPSSNWIPAMRFTGQQAQSNGFALNFTTLPGYWHALQYKDTLAGTNGWQTLTNLDGTGRTAAVLDLSATNTTRFYRLASQPAP